MNFIYRDYYCVNISVIKYNKEGHVNIIFRKKSPKKICRHCSAFVMEVATDAKKADNFLISNENDKINGGCSV